MVRKISIDFMEISLLFKANIYGTDLKCVRIIIEL